VLHAIGLLRHQLQVAVALRGRQGQRPQGFNEADEHRERRADLVRHVGHEVAPHGLGLFQRGDVARQQQLAPVAVRMQSHGDAHRPRRRAVSPRHDHVVREVLRGQVGAERRLAQQVADLLPQVAPGVQAEVLRRRLVEPLHVALGVQQHHAIGRGLQRGQQLVQTLLAGHHLLLLLAQPAAHAGAGLAPQAVRGRARGCRAVLAQPANHAQTPPGLPAEGQPRGDGDAPGSAPGPQKSPAGGGAAQLQQGEYGDAPEHGIRKNGNEIRLQGSGVKRQKLSVW